MSVGVWAAGEAASFHAPVQGRFARWGSGRILALRIASPADAIEAVARLERELEHDERFGVVIEGPLDLVHLQRLLHASPEARRRLRRMRPALGTWCAGVAHVVIDVPGVMWPAEVLWGCRATATAQRDAAEAWLRARLAT